MTISDFKNFIGAFAVILVFIGYVPYIRDILKSKTIPHIYSWFLWAFVTSIAFALQISDKAGAGALVTLASVIMGCAVIVLSLVIHKGKRDITKLDAVFFILGFISLGIWVIAKQPVIAAILVTSAKLLGFFPTIRKSWNKPYSETLSFYILNSFRFGLATLSLQHYSILTALFPISWFVANGLFVLMLMARRKKLLK